MAPTDRPRGRNTRGQRASDLARLSASTGAGFLASRVRALRDADGAELQFHTQTAEKMLELLGSMRGAAMKVGQLASFVDLDLPPEAQETYHDILAALRDAPPAEDPAAIAEVVTEQYGAPPERVFAHWDSDPLASASIGQVHRAVLPDGTDVAVKVQYPGVAEAIEADLANVEMFAPLARMVSPNLAIRPLLEEMRDRLIDELDYQREAQYQAAFHARYHGHPFIRVPAVLAEWCRPRVLVTEYVAGADFETMMRRTDADERRRYGEIIYRFVFGSIHRFRLFNADPHPGNYLFPDDPAAPVVFLDFGSVKTFSSRTREQIRLQMSALVAGDDDGLVALLDESGFLPRSGHVDRERLVSWFRVFNRPVLTEGEFTYTPEFAREVVGTTTDPRLGYVDMLRRLNLPADYLMLNRIQWGVNSILGRLRARANWQQITREFWGDSGPATALGAQEHEFISASPYRA
jgi:predicted unusual protein kinase regulating ubiquinone biosynthesis (AarF/ABC1/UbiB family)